jgi:hypothetical protein
MQPRDVLPYLLRHIPKFYCRVQVKNAMRASTPPNPAAIFALLQDADAASYSLWVVLWYVFRHEQATPSNPGVRGIRGPLKVLPMRGVSSLLVVPFICHGYFIYTACRCYYLLLCCQAIKYSCFILLAAVRALLIYCTGRSLPGLSSFSRHLFLCSISTCQVL